MPRIETLEDLAAELSKAEAGISGPKGGDRAVHEALLGAMAPLKRYWDLVEFKEGRVDLGRLARWGIPRVVAKLETMLADLADAPGPGARPRGPGRTDGGMGSPAMDDGAEIEGVVSLPALRPGERVQIESDREPYDERPWCWMFFAPGRPPATGAASSQAEAVAALTNAIKAARA